METIHFATSNDWTALPYGGKVLCAAGVPVRVSDGATCATGSLDTCLETDGAEPSDIVRGLQELFGTRYTVDDWGWQIEDSVEAFADVTLTDDTAAP